MIRSVSECDAQRSALSARLFPAASLRWPGGRGRLRRRKANQTSKSPNPATSKVKNGWNTSRITDSVARNLGN